MPRADFSYTQTVIGDCGHQCTGWPVISGIGGTNPTVVCDVCTAEKYGLGQAEITGIAVWVRIKPEKKETVTKTPKKKKAPKPNMWDQFLPGTS